MVVKIKEKSFFFVNLRVTSWILKCTNNILSNYNKSVREMLGQRGIKPENLHPEEDIKKLERRVKSEEKKIAKGSGIFLENQSE